MPDAYTPADLIDRAEAERMIAEVVRFYGFTRIRCKWQRPKLVISPF